MTTRPQLSATFLWLLAYSWGAIGCDNPMVIGVHDDGSGGNYAAGGASNLIGTFSTGGWNSNTWIDPEPSGGASEGATGGYTGSGGTSSSSSGGLSNAGTGGAAISGSSSATMDNACGSSNPQYDGNGQLTRVGAADPIASVALGPGGYLMSPGVAGYCYTYADNKLGGSTIFPPCAFNETCFTEYSGLCVTASLGVASDNVWGAGLGCTLNQAVEADPRGEPISLVNKTSLSFELNGCKVPSSVQVRLNIEPPIYDADTDLLHSGYYCADVALSEPDANGARSGTVPISALHEDCWMGNGLALDPSVQTAASLQLEVNAHQHSRTAWDFCVSKLSLE